MKRGVLVIALTAVLAPPGQIVADQQHDESRHARTASSEKDDRDAGRWYWQLPNRVIAEIGIQPGMAVADIGAGEGYFATRIARTVGERGRVYANDVDSTSLEVLRNRAESQGLRNVEVVVGAPHDPRLPRGSVDLALMVNVINLLKDKSRFLEALKPALRPDGRLVVVQWDAEKMDPEMVGWKPENRSQFTQEATLGWIYGAGYDVVRILSFLPVQNIYICRPRPGKG